MFEIFVDEPTNTLQIKTTNKKYYKKIEIPDMTRAKLKLEKGKDEKGKDERGSDELTKAEEAYKLLNRLVGKMMSNTKEFEKDPRGEYCKAAVVSSQW